MCEKMGLDPTKIIAEKMAINRKRNWEIDEKIVSLKNPRYHSVKNDIVDFKLHDELCR